MIIVNEYNCYVTGDRCPKEFQGICTVLLQTHLTFGFYCRDCRAK